MGKLKQLYLNFNSKHKKLCEIIRFVIVGGIATVIDYFVMGLVLYLFNPDLYPHFYNVWIGKAGDPSTIATVVGTGTGFCVSLIANYLLSVFFVYEEEGNSKSVKGVIYFFLFSFGGLLLNMAGMWLGYDICGINEWITKIGMTLIVLVYNYTTRKLFIFNNEKVDSLKEKNKTDTLNDEIIIDDNSEKTTDNIEDNSLSNGENTDEVKELKNDNQ